MFHHNTTWKRDYLKSRVEHPGFPDTIAFLGAVRPGRKPCTENPDRGAPLRDEKKGYAVPALSYNRQRYRAWKSVRIGVTIRTRMNPI